LRIDEAANSTLARKRSPTIKTALTAVLAILVTTLHCHAQSSIESGEGTCGALANAFGPFEYRPDHFKAQPGDTASHADKLRIVEINHFNAGVETQLRGMTGHVGGDLDYTLRAFPNHHRALATLLRLAERSKEQAPGGLPRPLECYFNRASRFAPNDPIVRLLYATFLIRNSRLAEARPQIDYARSLAGNNAFTHYNVGLMYADAGDWDAALAQAHRAAAMGFTRATLKQRLQKAGKWAEPPAAVAAEPVPAAASAASQPAEAASRP
jgi:tetratricopeptide (TPR) repeat protein